MAYRTIDKWECDWCSATAEVDHSCRGDMELPERWDRVGSAVICLDCRQALSDLIVARADREVQS